MFILRFLLFCCLYAFFIKMAISNEKVNILEYLKSDSNYSIFYNLIKKANYEDLFISESKFKFLFSV